MGGHSEALTSVPKTSLDTTADVRDALTAIVGRGYTGLTDDEVRGHAAALRQAIGSAAGRKLVTHALLFNQRPDLARKSAEDRIRQFYSMPSSDPDISGFIQKAASFGEGPIAGMRSSGYVGNVLLSGRTVTK